MPGPGGGRLGVVLLVALTWAPESACEHHAPIQDTEARYRLMREKMVQTQIERRGIKDPRVLAALREVPRHLFVPENLKERAYDDNALPIGEDQTISQPYIVAIMTELLRLEGSERVLEIGTGSGYQAAVLSGLVDSVYTIEIIEALADQARQRLSDMACSNVSVRHGDGYKGWPDKAPFDAIILTAAPPSIPQPLIQQLKNPGGVLVAPVGPSSDQRLVRLTRTKKGVSKEHLMFVRFVPMTGKAQGKK